MSQLAIDSAGRKLLPGVDRSGRCGFAFPGTYGHECGRPAVKVGLIKAERSANGVFYAKRCESCAAIKGGENRDIYAWEPYDASRHVNAWRY